MKILLSVAMLVFLAGCVTRTTLISNDGKTYEMKVDSVFETLIAEIDAVTYKGSYVTNSSHGTGYAQFFGSAPASGFTAVSTQGNAGQAILTAPNGDHLECQFNYSGLTVMGRCKSKNGREFLLTTNR